MLNHHQDRQDRPAAPGEAHERSEHQRQSMVFVVDDDPGFLDALSQSLRVAGHRVNAFCSSSAFLDAYDPKIPGCLVMDVRMPGLDGIQVQGILAERGAPIPIVFVTGHGDVPMAVNALKRGAVDFLEKPFSQQALLESIGRAMARDERRRLLESERSTIIARLDLLTPREREVLSLVVTNMAAKEIAAELNISPRTVEHHRENLMEKMGAKSSYDLVIMAVICGLYEPVLDDDSDTAA
jgi:FixJ family two-component response regulator